MGSLFVLVFYGLWVVPLSLSLGGTKGIPDLWERGFALDSSRNVWFAFASTWKNKRVVENDAFYMTEPLVGFKMEDLTSSNCTSRETIEIFGTQANNNSAWLVSLCSHYPSPLLNIGGYLTDDNLVTSLSCLRLRHEHASTTLPTTVGTLSDTLALRAGHCCDNRQCRPCLS